ncbi:uncharacterized protein BXZ73DRAFT_83569 [Epithele typhae]|uniref:uncharacterized protein n=1 Tax=Epithele typhae TaxID=378194 RepID=UPI0020073534|nr:uncharacterized protein BXZ73DRAFT_83569 [Epithele typhae]KAH9910443.1 hypothetical protein BXZ73DRAFT_83569 [Epithele typhae]
MYGAFNKPGADRVLYNLFPTNLGNIVNKVVTTGHRNGNDGSNGGPSTAQDASPVEHGRQDERVSPTCRPRSYDRNSRPQEFRLRTLSRGGGGPPPPNAAASTGTTQNIPAKRRIEDSIHADVKRPKTNNAQPQMTPVNVPTLSDGLKVWMDYWETKPSQPRGVRHIAKGNVKINPFTMSGHIWTQIMSRKYMLTHHGTRTPFLESLAQVLSDERRAIKKQLHKGTVQEYPKICEWPNNELADFDTVVRARAFLQEDDSDEDEDEPARAAPHSSSKAQSAAAMEENHPMDAANSLARDAVPFAYGLRHERRTFRGLSVRRC